MYDTIYMQEKRFSIDSIKPKHRREQTVQLNSCRLFTKVKIYSAFASRLYMTAKSSIF